MKVEVNFSKKHLFVGMFLILGVLGVVSVYAWANSQGVGHSLSEIETCGPGKVLKMNSAGTSWECGDDVSGGGGAGGSSIVTLECGNYDGGCPEGYVQTSADSASGDKKCCVVGTLITKRIFVSSQSYSGNLGGLSGADDKCQELADSADLGGTWKAVLSDSSNSASNRVGYNWNLLVNMQGQVVAKALPSKTAREDLWDGNLQNAVKYTETGGNPNSVNVWTGTGLDGLSRTDTCGDWSSEAEQSLLGESDSLYNWMWDNLNPYRLDCNQQAYIYCIEQ